MSTKEKIGCVIAFAKLLIQIPLAYALTFLILRHINATETMWLLFWIGTLISFAFSVVMTLTEKIVLSGKEE